MKCADCIYEKMCESRYERQHCFSFKDKSDFVEIVRCKDCKYYKAYEPPIEDFGGWCSVNENEYDKDFYCSYGERSENGTN